jgi:hypothetical protein
MRVSKKATFEVPSKFEIDSTQSTPPLTGMQRGIKNSVGDF